jgi:hypothetical protein
VHINKQSQSIIQADGSTCVVSKSSLLFTLGWRNSSISTPRRTETLFLKSGIHPNGARARLGINTRRRLAKETRMG